MCPVFRAKWCNCWGLVDVDDFAVDKGFEGFGKSFLTREREEDSNATPPNTTSLICPPTLEMGLLDTGGTGGVGVDIGGVTLGVVVVVEAGFEGPATFRPGRIYLLAAL